MKTYKYKVTLNIPNSVILGDDYFLEMLKYQFKSEIQEGGSVDVETLEHPDERQY